MTQKKRLWWRPKQPIGTTNLIAAILLAIGAGIFLTDASPELKVAYCALSCIAGFVFFLIFVVSINR